MPLVAHVSKRSTSVQKLRLRVVVQKFPTVRVIMPFRSFRVLVKIHDESATPGVLNKKNLHIDRHGPTVGQLRSVIIDGMPLGAAPGTNESVLSVNHPGTAGSAPIRANVVAFKIIAKGKHIVAVRRNHSQSQHSQVSRKSAGKPYSIFYIFRHSVFGACVWIASNL